MNAAGVQDSLEQLGDLLSDLQKNLQPLLTGSLSETTKKLPLLDRAKLYITLVYAIESLLFSYLRLQGVDAKEHNVMKEIKRVQQYFTKITAAEESGVKRDTTLDKPAVNRMIKHALAGNQKLDLEYAERRAKELLVAKRKLQELQDRKRQRDLQAANSSPATPAASESNAQSPEVEASKVANAISKVREFEAAAAAAAMEVDNDTPESPAPSEGSSQSARKGKKRRLQEARVETPSGKNKKKKRKHAVGAVGTDDDS